MAFGSDVHDTLAAQLDAGEHLLGGLTAAVPNPSLETSLQAVADEIPLVVPVDFVNIRLVGSDHLLHLVAASGCTTADVRKRALRPLPVARVREMLASGAHDRLARSLGVEWIDAAWMAAGSEEVGALAAGTRTKRRPTDAQKAVLRETVDELARRLHDVDRSAKRLRRASLRLAQRSTPSEWSAPGPSAKLRPRERTILELYADGLSTGDIASLLVISPHTVRTHVKLALRRLGVHSRDEAAAVVRSDQLGELL